MRIVLRIGGSILGSPPDVALLDRYLPVISRIRHLGHSLGIVVGGGPIARQYINSARELGLSSEEQDLIAIAASRLNAKLVGMRLGAPDIPVTVQAMTKNLDRDGIAVMGGLRPGITTDTVAALIATRWRAALLVKASDQKGIYTSDPRSDKNAKLLRSLSYGEFRKILGGKHKPGVHSIVDPVAVERIAKDKLTLVVVEGHEPENVLRAVMNEPVGTIVS